MFSDLIICSQPIDIFIVRINITNIMEYVLILLPKFLEKLSTLHHVEKTILNYFHQGNTAIAVLLCGNGRSNMCIVDIIVYNTFVCYKNKWMLQKSGISRVSFVCKGQNREKRKRSEA